MVSCSPNRIRVPAEYMNNACSPRDSPAHAPTGFLHPQTNTYDIIANNFGLVCMVRAWIEGFARQGLQSNIESHFSGRLPTGILYPVWTCEI